jgi:hypothetical protein
VLLPEELGEPDGLFYSSFPEGGRISLVYRPREDLPRSRQTGVGLLVTQFRGDLSPDFVGKLADQSVRLLPTSVGEFPAIWLEGGPHVVYFRDRSGVVVEDAVRLAGNTLLLEHGRTLVRLEGTLGQERAEEIAASLRPAG